MAVVVGAEALKETPGKVAILPGAVRKLMASPSIHAHRNHDIFVDVEWGGDSLSKCIDYVIVGVGAIMKIRAKCRLIFLRLQ